MPRFPLPPRRITIPVTVFGALAVMVACGSGSGDGSNAGRGSGNGSGSGSGSGSLGGGGSGAGDGSYDGGFTDTFDAGGDATSGSSSSDGGGSSSPLGGHFRHGMNGGHVNPNFTDNDDGLLGALVGADSNRIKLPQYFLDQWGANVRVDAAKSYADNGMSNLVCFLIGPSAGHSTAPSAGDASTGTLEQYIPKDLDAPIFAADGSVNPGNSWAKYVEETVTAYKPWVRIWEVWNEPDWTPNYATTLGWATAAPTKADLPRFNGSVFDYVRMLRVTYAVAKKVDPTALVALGGIGYPTFLSAILRYTDNPSDGSITAVYPNKGDAYFDVLNFHYYPIYTPGNSDAAVGGLVKMHDDLQAELTRAHVTGKSWNATETGAPRYAFGTNPGGDDYAKNYILKAMIQAQLEGMLGLDWFLLADGAKPGASTDPYQYMGLYLNTTGLTATKDAVKTDTGVAYSTLGKLLKNAAVDADATAALALPSTVGGGAFVAADGRHVVALWAKGTTGEGAVASYALDASGPVAAYAWNYAATGASTTVTPAAGKATLSLTATPVFFVRP